jgi:S1-C subfamily serine protease
MERIRGILTDRPLEALWRAALLAGEDKGDDAAVGAEKGALLEQAVATVTGRYDDAVTVAAWGDALRLRRSLDAVGAPPEGGRPVEDLLARANAGVPGLGSTNAVGSYTTKQALSGTVTVWLDLGIKVEHGVGYAASSLGSGFFVDKRGYLVTNYHVIQSQVDPEYEGFSRLYVRLTDDPDTRIPAKVVGWDPVLDLALLKTEVAPPYVFTLGSSAALEPGDRIQAIGSPVGLDRTVTSGIVSAMNRPLLSLGTVMQIDAAVNPGNSGGPIVDDQGRVQAVVFAGALAYEGLNFAIPVEYLLAVLPQLYQGGERPQSWTGAYGRTTRDPEGTSGIEVQYVLPGGSADRAGLTSGDILTTVNGAPVGKLEELQGALIPIPVDTIARLEGRHADGESFALPVYLARRPQNPGYEVYRRDVIARAFGPIFGMELLSTSATSKRRYAVTRVLRGSIADESGFSVQDPVDVLKVRVNPDKDAIYAELYTKKRKNGYFDVNIAIGAPLDSPYYF